MEVLEVYPDDDAFGRWYAVVDAAHRAARPVVEGATGLWRLRLDGPT